MAIAAPVLILFCASASPALAQYEVFDPWTFQEQTITYAQAVQQVAQGAQQLEQLQNQLAAQQSMIQSLGADAKTMAPMTPPRVGTIGLVMFKP
ncbi:hypothetical protein, partial [Klebsiella pneumoniae]